MTDDVIAKSMAEATIHAPLTAIDLTEWVFALTDSEYQACSKNHITAAVTVTPEGKRMSINVVHVGNLMVHHYVEDVAERRRNAEETPLFAKDIEHKALANRWG